MPHTRQKAAIKSSTFNILKNLIHIPKFHQIPPPKLSHTVITALCGINKENSIITLDLSMVNIDDAIAIISVKGAGTNHTLKVTHANATHIAGLSCAFKENSVFTSINFMGSHIGNKGVEALAKALKRNNIVNHLNLRHNQITDKGIKILADMLETNRSLITVDLRNNDIREIGGIALIKALENNRSIIELYADIGLSYNTHKGIACRKEVLRRQKLNDINPCLRKNIMAIKEALAFYMPAPHADITMGYFGIPDLTYGSSFNFFPRYPEFLPIAEEVLDEEIVNTPLCKPRTFLGGF
ncbi:MAG: hypothetical protein K0Q74_327 [Gammaproteobacteria bacterium]|jgi:Ran GTPase-activating protein (RanGAP) involved in mRNA processing and transport|nr:hypothetical protein [Gammaproteobacteria bacterium]